MKYLIAFVCAAVLLLIIWALRGVLLLPVVSNGNTEIKTLVCVNGDDNELEHTLCALLWLRENGTLKSKIIIQLNGCGDDTAKIAESYAAERTGIQIIRNGD